MHLWSTYCDALPLFTTPYSFIHVIAQYAYTSIVLCSRTHAEWDYAKHHHFSRLCTVGTWFFPIFMTIYVSNHMKYFFWFYFPREMVLCMMKVGHDCKFIMYCKFFKTDSFTIWMARTFYVKICCFWIWKALIITFSYHIKDYLYWIFLKKPLTLSKDRCYVQRVLEIIFDIFRVLLYPGGQFCWILNLTICIICKLQFKSCVNLNQDWLVVIENDIVFQFCNRKNVSLNTFLSLHVFLHLAPALA